MNKIKRNLKYKVRKGNLWKFFFNPQRTNIDRTYFIDSWLLKLKKNKKVFFSQKINFKLYSKHI